MVVDDELYSLWSQFAAGVRIFALSDSCHSGTVVRDLQAARDFFAAIRPALTRGYGISSEPRIKRIDPATLAAIEARDRAVYRSVQWTAGDSRELINEIEARIIGISACQDNQVALDGDTNGLFTSALLKVWANGTFQGGYDGFASAIIAGMPFSQTPNFYKIGAEDPAFDSYKPFELLEAASVQPAGNGAQTHPSVESATAGPSVIGPGSTDRAKPPAFEVVRGANPYYVFEIASEAGLFDNPPRFNDYRYYASSNDGSASARETSPHYQLSPAAWDLIKRNDTLYYRITTMAGPSGWSHCETSTVRILTVTDGLGKSAPAPSAVRRRPPAPHIM
jgi:hypothetical protein